LKNAQSNFGFNFKGQTVDYNKTNGHFRRVKRFLESLEKAETLVFTGPNDNQQQQFFSKHNTSVSKRSNEPKK